MSKIKHVFIPKASNGANELKELMDLKRIKTEGSKFKGESSKFVINWGSTKLPPEVAKSTVLNRPEAIRLSSNKLSFFKLIQKSKYKDIIPPFTEDKKQVFEWLKQGHHVVARTVLNGSGGVGIVVIHKNDPEVKVPDAPLYVLYIPKKEEYRVHVVGGKVVAVQRKTLSSKIDNKKEVNWKIRNLENGFIYQREGINPDKSVLDVALKAMEVTGLDFGGVDIVYGHKDNTAYVLEINTAPGLQGTTVSDYKKAFEENF
jgi:glutathione synthase/RimK-type ligase-like ATP-grasp enzyme